jgi:hypothetical protein
LPLSLCIINLRFAYFLIAIRLGDAERQRQEYAHLLWLIGRTGNYQEEWRSIAGLCIAKEISKHSYLDIPTIVAWANRNSFAYLWIAGKRDFANLSQSQWRHNKSEKAREESFHYKADAVAAENTAKELQQIAKGLPKQVAVLVESIADIYKNRVSLEGVAGDTDTRIRLSLVREAARRLGMSEKQVKRHLAGLQNPASPELAAVKVTMAEAAREAQERQNYPCSFPPVSPELLEEISKRLKTNFQPYQFYKELDNKNSTIQHGIELPSKKNLSEDEE